MKTVMSRLIGLVKLRFRKVTKKLQQVSGQDYKAPTDLEATRRCASFISSCIQLLDWRRWAHVWSVRNATIRTFAVQLQTLSEDSIYDSLIQHQQGFDVMLSLIAFVYLPPPTVWLEVWSDLSFVISCVRAPKMPFFRGTSSVKR